MNGVYFAARLLAQLSRTPNSSESVKLSHKWAPLPKKEQSQPQAFCGSQNQCYQSSEKLLIRKIMLAATQAFFVFTFAI
jgi:hypothetical protein